jgi:hypothetical protein
MGKEATTVERGVALYECAMCRAPVTMTEKNGLGYCEAHWRTVHPQRLRRLLGAIRRAPAPARLHARFTRRATS